MINKNELSRKIFNNFLLSNSFEFSKDRYEIKKLFSSSKQKKDIYYYEYLKTYKQDLLLKLSMID